MKYFLLDSARAGLDNLELAKKLNPSYRCMYSGALREVLSSVAPYLFVCEENNEFDAWIFNSGVGNSWGVQICSHASFNEIYIHLRKFMLVSTHEGQELYFRFYDPRVLRVFLPTCDKEQLREFFGPISHFIMEDEEISQALVFSLERDGSLYTELKPAEALLEFKPHF